MRGPECLCDWVCRGTKHRDPREVRDPLRGLPLGLGLARRSGPTPLSGDWTHAPAPRRGPPSPHARRGHREGGSLYSRVFARCPVTGWLVDGLVRGLVGRLAGVAGPGRGCTAPPLDAFREGPRGAGVGPWTVSLVGEPVGEGEPVASSDDPGQVVPRTRAPWPDQSGRGSLDGAGVGDPARRPGVGAERAAWRGGRPSGRGKRRGGGGVSRPTPLRAHPWAARPRVRGPEEVRKSRQEASVPYFRSFFLCHSS